MRGCPLPTNLPFKVQHIQDKRSLEEGARGGRERVELLASCSLSARSLGRRQGHSSLSPPRRSMWACPDSTGRDVRESRSSRASCPQATAGVTSANVQSARARHVAEPRIGMRGRCKFTRYWHGYQEGQRNGVVCATYCTRYGGQRNCRN